MYAYQPAPWIKKHSVPHWIHKPGKPDFLFDASLRTPMLFFKTFLNYGFNVACCNHCFSVLNGNVLFESAPVHRRTHLGPLMCSSMASNKMVNQLFDCMLFLLDLGVDT